MATTKTDLKLLPPFYPPEGPEVAPDHEDELPDGMHQGPHISRATQSSWDTFYEVERPDQLQPLLGFDAPVYYKDEDGRTRHVVPDFFFAFDINGPAVMARNGYFIEEVGKAPDVVFEVASVTTYANDLGRKRELYLSLGVEEYWGFDPTGGEYYGAPLWGVVSVDGERGDIEVEYDEESGTRQAYSPRLDLYVCVGYDPDPSYYGQFQLRFQDPHTGQYLMTPKESEAARRESEAALRESEAARGWLESQLNIQRASRESERQAREAAEARIRELEERLRRYEP